MSPSSTHIEFISYSVVRACVVRECVISPPCVQLEGRRAISSFRRCVLSKAATLPAWPCYFTCKRAISSFGRCVLCGATSSLAWLCGFTSSLDSDVITSPYFLDIFEETSLDGSYLSLTSWTSLKKPLLMGQIFPFLVDAVTELLYPSIHTKTQNIAHSPIFTADFFRASPLRVKRKREREDFV